MSDDNQTIPAVRPLTAQLYTALMLDGWPSSATCQDFGLTSQAHYAALGGHQDDEEARDD